MVGVPVDVEQGRNEHRHQGQSEGDRDISQEWRRLAVDQVERERNHAGTEQERAQPEAEDGEWQRQAREDRPQDGVDERDHGGDKHRGAEGEGFDAGQDRGEDHQRQTRDCQQDQRPDHEPQQRPPAHHVLAGVALIDR